MNEEYLWNKTGDDTEIKKLENALGAFRYREDSPPVLPIVETEPRSNGWRFSLVFATAAFATVAIAAVGWFQISTGNDDDEITFVYYPAVENTQQQQQQSVEPQPPVVEPQPAPKQPTLRGRPVIQSTYASAPLPQKRTPNPKTQKVSTESLTAQERYAYNQLMLALSISSAKLKIVHDAVNGVEDTDSNKKENNR
jgi:hypothetical protein